MDELRGLWARERRLNQAWQEAVEFEDWTEAAEIRRQYKENFDKLLALCWELRIITKE